MTDEQRPGESRVPTPEEFETMTDETFHSHRSGFAAKLLAVVFGIGVGLGLGKLVFKQKVSEAELLQVEARAAQAENAVQTITRDLEDLRQEFEGKTCFGSTSDPEFEKVRQAVLASMSGSDAYALAGAEAAKIASFLQNNDRLWRVHDETMDERFDEETASLAIGRYKGDWDIAFPGQEKVTLTFDLDLQGFASKGKPNVMSYRDKDGAFTSTIEFRKKLLGTQKDEKMMHLVLDNSFKNSRDDVLFYGFRFPATLKKSQRARGKVLGLTPDRQWQVLGEYRIQRL